MANINVNNLEYTLRNAGFPPEVVASVQEIPGIHDRFLVDRDEAAKFLYFRGTEQQDRALVSEFKRASTIANNFPTVSVERGQKPPQQEIDTAQKEQRVFGKRPDKEEVTQAHQEQVVRGTLPLSEEKSEAARGNIGIDPNLPLASVVSDEYKVCASNIGAPFPDQFSFFRSDDFHACVQHCRENAGYLLKQCSQLDIFTKDGEWVGGYRAGPMGISECMQRAGGRFEQTAVIPYRKDDQVVSRDSDPSPKRDVKNVDKGMDR